MQEAVLKEELLTGGQEIREFAAKHTEQLNDVRLQIEDLHCFVCCPFREVRERLRQAWRRSLKKPSSSKTPRFKIPEQKAILAALG